jgi:hypothetical protein
MSFCSLFYQPEEPWLMKSTSLSLKYHLRAIAGAAVITAWIFTIQGPVVKHQVHDSKEAARISESFDLHLTTFDKFVASS